MRLSSDEWLKNLVTLLPERIKDNAKPIFTHAIIAGQARH